MAFVVLLDSVSYFSEFAVNSLRCATASIDVTPRDSITLAGYTGREEPFEDISDRLEANAIFLSSGSVPVLFISVDLLYVGPDIQQVIESHALQYDLPASNIILSASHTHFAPATDATKPRLGQVDANYLHWLKSQLKRLVDQVMKAALSEVQIDWQSADMGLNINRRRRWPFPTWTRKGVSLKPRIIMAPNDKAFVDLRADVLRFWGINGELLCVIWKYACHPVGFPKPLSVSAEYPGFVRTELRRALNRSIPIVFWQGFAGDVRPNIPCGWSWGSLIHSIRRGPSFSEVSLSDWTSWVQQMADHVVALTMTQKTQPLNGKLSVTSTSVALANLIDGAVGTGKTRPLCFQKIAFGSDLKILFVGAEVCSPYIQIAKSNVPQINVGYVGNVFGYLPTQEQAKEGGYEGGGFFNVFDLTGKFSRDLNDVWKKALQSL